MPKFGIGAVKGDVDIDIDGGVKSPKGDIDLDIGRKSKGGFHMPAFDVDVDIYADRGFGLTKFEIDQELREVQRQNEELKQKLQKVEQENIHLKTELSNVKQDQLLKKITLGQKLSEISDEDLAILIKQLSKEKKSRASCVVCMERVRRIICLPCGHFCMCLECCKENTSLCPMCCQPLQGTQKVFIN